MRWRPSDWRVWAFVCAVTALTSALAVAQAPTPLLPERETTAEAPSPQAAIVASEAPPTESQSTSHAATPEPGVVRRGTGEFTTPAPTAQIPTNPTAERLDIVFERAPAGLVVQSLLADFAHANVIIDPRVSGEITIRSTGQLTAAELPSFLQSSVAAIGLQLIEQSPNVYLLRPAPDQSEASSAEVFRPGLQTNSGLVVYGLRFVSATEMVRLLQPFLRSGVTAQAERNREMLILTGPPSQVQSLVGTISLLDVDWLQGMSFGLVPLQYAEPEQLITELRTLFGGAEGPVGSMVEFVPLPARRAVLILAKRPDRLDQARTWIMQLDRPLTTSGRIRMLEINNADAERIAETLSRLFTDGEDATTRITSDAGRNALLVESDPATFEEISALVRQLDTPRDQVVIEATIAEVVLNNDMRFGVQWSFDTRDGGRATLSEANNGAIVARFPGFSYGFTGNYVQAALNALSSRTNVEIISTPVVVTLDNQEAVLQVGDEVPVVTQSAANVTTPGATVINTVQYRETGILLRVTPRITSNDFVTLDVTQEASEVATNTTSGIDSPTIQQRRFQSTVSIANGETVALGGLIRATRTRTRSGVPLISQVPVLGAAFSNSNEIVRRTELLVFLTPRIVRSSDDARTVTDDLEHRLRRLRTSRFIQSHAPAH
jgi:general secretion pathway protein D